MCNVPFVYWSVNLWRTLHPKTTVVSSLPSAMGTPLLFSTVAFLGLFGVLLALRMQLEHRRADLDALYLALDDSDERLIARSIAALTPLIGITGEPLFTRVYRFERGNAQHEVGHLTRVAAIDRALARHPGLFVTGSGFRGVGIPDCVSDGRATARQVETWLKQ